MTDAYHFRAFGLNILSDLPIGTLEQGPDAPHDVRIRSGCVKDHLGPGTGKISIRNWEADGRNFLLKVQDVARFWITTGSRIVIDPAPGAHASDIEAYLLGSAFAALLQQRRLLTLHASAIDTPQGAVLFMGKSGAGKSTLLAALLARGYSMITDDISALDFARPDAPMVHPAFPMLRLSRSALTTFGHRAENLTPMRADKDKFLLPADTFCETPRPLRHAFLLSPQDRGDVVLKPLNPADQFQWLTQFTFRKNYYNGHGLEPFHFGAVSSLARRKVLTKVIRPTRTFDIQGLADRIEQALG